MSENLFRVMKEYIPVDVGMQQDLEKILIKKNIASGECILREGQISSSLIFIEEGSAYYYKIDEQGKKRVINFNFEGDIFVDVESYVNDSKTDLYIETLEPSIIYCWEKKDWEKLLAADLRWERLMRLYLQKVFIKIIEERKNMKTLSNTEHYLKLLKTYPNLFQRVPLYLIASYLNITPEGLSKIRRRLSCK
ncbi:MAG: Crp/Fnr family transcriptional regulator [Aureispira sp.]